MPMSTMKHLIVLLTTLFITTSSFSFQLPKFPWDAPLKPTISTSKQPKSPISQNDKIVIFGATGGVGQLVTKKLLNKNSYRVCVVARD